MALRELTAGVHVVDHPFRIGGVHMGLRTTVLDLGGGRTLVHSPGPLEEPDLASIRALGRVEAIVAPNAYHHLFVEPARRALGDPPVYAAPLLRTRVARFASAAPLEDAPWAGVIETEPLGGVPRMGEVVLLHRPSRTLLLTDAAFNLRASASWVTRVAMKVNDAYDKFGPSRVFRMMVKDAGALRASLHRILEWPIERITVTHGDVVESDGAAVVRAAYARWLQ